MTTTQDYEWTHRGRTLRTHEDYDPTFDERRAEVFETRGGKEFLFVATNDHQTADMAAKRRIDQEAA